MLPMHGTDAEIRVGGRVAARARRWRLVSEPADATGVLRLDEMVDRDDHWLAYPSHEVRLRVGSVTVQWSPDQVQRIGDDAFKLTGMPIER